MLDFRFLRNLPALLVSVILVGEAIAFYLAPTAEYVPHPPALATFTRDIGPWSMVREIELDADTQKILKADDTLNRSYVGPEGPLSLYVAFFKSQRGGVTPHSPKICLPGSGWTPEGSRTIHLNVAGSGSIPINRYVVRRGEDRSVVLYWYATAHSEIADEYVSKLYLMYEGLRYQRSDAAVYRVIVQVGPEGEEAAEKQAISFVHAFYPQLKQRMWSN